MTVRRVSCPSFRFLTVLVLAATLAVASCQTQPFGFPGIPVEALPQRPDDPIPVCDGDIGILLFCVNLHCMNGEKWLKDAEAAEKALDFSWNAFSPRGHALRRMTALCGYRPITLYFDTDACPEQEAFFQMDQEEFFRRHPPTVSPEDVEWHKEPEVLREELKLKEYKNP